MAYQLIVTQRQIIVDPIENSHFLLLLLLFSMMTSSNGNIFRVTGHMCGEFTGPRWIPRTKASDAELWCFLCLICVWINGWVNNRKAGDLRRCGAQYNVTVMSSFLVDSCYSSSLILQGGYTWLAQDLKDIGNINQGLTWINSNCSLDK